MCSVNPDLDDGTSNILMPPLETIKGITECRKCKNAEPVVVLQSKFPYCKCCFTELVSHKFFGCLGKSKLMKSSDDVLVLCSGSQSSSALLHLINIGLHGRQKKIFSQAYVLFIDVGSFVPLSVSERLDLVKQMKSMLKHFSFKSYYSPLVYSKSKLKNMDDDDWCTTEFLEEVSLKSLTESVTTATAREDLLTKMRSSVAVSVARELGCSKIFSGDTNDQIAAKILTDVALGRGDHLPLDTGFSDDRYEDLVILRPLRDCSRKEIAFYCLLHNSPFVVYPKAGFMKGKDNSIQKLTERFVAELQVSYPSTVCMVVGTGNKLSAKQTSLRSQITCPLCKANLKNPNEDELSAESATHISHLISTEAPENLNCKDFSTTLSSNSSSHSGTNCDVPGKTGCNCSKGSTSVSLNDIRDTFCYGCQLILKDLKHLDDLPPEVIKEAHRNSKLCAMRNEINEFLL